MAIPFDEFPPEVAQAVDGLAWLGYLELEVSRWGHSWVLRTLKADEELQASLLAKEYADTFGQVKAHAWATVALALDSVDGDENFCPAIGPDDEKNARARFVFCTKNWYWPIGEYLFGQYITLANTQGEALDAIDSLLSGSLRNSWPSPDSSKTQGDSQEGLIVSNLGSQPISPEVMKTLANLSE